MANKRVVAYTCIASYPESKIPVGAIIRQHEAVWGTGKPQEFVRNPELYPHIFRAGLWEVIE